MDATIASGPILIVRVLPGQQVMVHCRNSKYIIPLIRSLFVLYSCRHCQICVCYLFSCGRGGYTATRLNEDDAVTRLASLKVGGRVEECGRAARGLSRAEVANSSISDSVRLELGRGNLQVRSPRGTTGNWWHLVVVAHHYVAVWDVDLRGSIQA